MLQVGIDVRSRHFGRNVQLNDGPSEKLTALTYSACELFRRLDAAAPAFIPEYLEMSLL
jgi:hypothetical protein